MIPFFPKNLFEKDAGLKRKRKSKAAHLMAINKISMMRRETLTTKTLTKMKNTRSSNIFMKNIKKIPTTFLKTSVKS